MRLNETLSGLVLLVIGMVVSLHAGTFPPAPGAGVGPGFFPMLVGAGIAITGAALVINGWRARAVPRLEWEEWARQPAAMLRAVLAISALVLYPLVVDTAGFFITGFAFLAVLFLAFGASRRWIVPLAAGVTLGLHLVFYSLLRVPLPWGWLEGVAW